MSNQGNLCRDGIFGNLQIKGKVALDRDRNLFVKDTKIRGNAQVNKTLRVNCIDSLEGESIKVKAPIQTTETEQFARVLTEADIERRSLNGDVSENYDIIVCGAGTAGCILVHDLAVKYPTKKILLIESGKDDVQDNETVRTDQDGPNPNLYDDSNPFLTDDWGQLIRGELMLSGEGAAQIQQKQRSMISDQYIPQQKILGMSRGVTLGGTSATNAQLWNRGTKIGTYDKWEEATGSTDFGWDSMNDVFKTIENRSQLTRFYGTPIPLWFPALTPALPDGAKFDPQTQGDSGMMYITQTPFPLQSYTGEASKEVVSSGLGSRSLQINLNGENPNNPPEYQSDAPFTEYDQSDPSFPTFNPYPSTTPGLIYDPPNPLGTTRDGSFAGIPAKLDGVPVTPGFANNKKSIHARCFSAPAFLYPLLYPVGNPNVPNNVTIKTKCYVTDLIFNPDDPTECVGVNYVENGWHVANVARAIRRDVKPWKGTFSDVDRSLCTEDQAKINQSVALAGGINEAYAKADVWICMGTLDSAALLQRSGIGSKNHLETLNYSPVSCRVDLPGVGQGVQDTCDMLFACANEIDWNTYLPAFTGAPSSCSSDVYKSVFGFADPADPTDPIGSSSISGAPIDTFGSGRLRVKSAPSVNHFDFDLLTIDTTAALVPFGNILWGDIVANLQNTPNTIDVFNKKLAVADYDRSSKGLYSKTGTRDAVAVFGILNEFWNAQSKGEVLITSNNPFDRPNYAPNMLSNENDLEAFENHFVNNILPLCSSLALKKRGPRGPFSYAGIIGTGGHTATTTNVQLLSSVTTSLFKPFNSAYVMTQGNYDTPGFLVGATLTMASGAAAIPGNNQRVVTAWSGFTGAAATSYVATVSAFGGSPSTTDQYTLALSTETPLDSVEFTGNNHRNFVRFLYPNGDCLFSDLGTQILSTDPITTYAGSTRLTFDASDHGFSVGEMIKISGVSSAVDSISNTDINDYHIVMAVPDSDMFEINIFWNSTAEMERQEIHQSLLLLLLRLEL